MARSTTRCVLKRSTMGLTRRCGSAPGSFAARRLGYQTGAVLESLEQRSLLSFSWTSEEVYLTELVNRARANPQAEGIRLGLDLTQGLSGAELARLVPQEPLALNPYLTAAARAHSADMAARNFFDHTNPDGDSPTDRARDAGYGGTAGENIAAGHATVDLAHRAWMESVGHRKNILSLHSSFDNTFHYDEFGPGMAFNAGGAYNHYYTQVFGNQGGTPARYLLGVVFDDASGDDFYSIGEGATGVRIDVALESAPSTVVATYTTDAAGNYQIALPSGSYIVTFTRIADGKTVAKQATIGDKNVKVDAMVEELQSVVVDDFADQGEWNAAGVIAVDPATGNGVKVGILESNGDSDLFRFVAAKSGATTITLTHPSGQFGMQLTVYNDAHALVKTGTAGGEFGNGSVAQVTLTAGKTYYLLARATVSTSLGTYILLMQGPANDGGGGGGGNPTDDYADIGEIAQASVVNLEETHGHGTKVGYLETAGDSDLFKLVLPRTGTTQITVRQPAELFAMRGRLYNESGTEIQVGTVSGLESVITLDGTEGETYYLGVEAANGTSVGIYTVQVIGPGPEPEPPQPVEINAGVMPAYESLVATAWFDGKLTLVFMNGWGQPLVAQQQADGSWVWSDIRGLAGEPEVDGDIMAWTDNRDGLKYAAVRGIEGLVLFKEYAPGQWSYRNLSEEIDLALYISMDIELLFDPLGRANLIGFSDGGDLIVYSQLWKRNGAGEWKWTFRNITAKDFEPNDIETPWAASELVSWQSKGGGCNLVFLDEYGDMQMVFKPKGTMKWRLQNLSSVVEHDPLIGELAIFTTKRDNGVHIAATDEFGQIWVTSYSKGNGWWTRNITQRLRGPTFEIRSLSAYSSRSGVWHLVGIKDDGDIGFYKYNPARRHWSALQMELTTPDFRNMAGRLDARFDWDSRHIAIAGSLDSGRLALWQWKPGAGWNFSEMSTVLANA